MGLRDRLRRRGRPGRSSGDNPVVGSEGASRFQLGNRIENDPAFQVMTVDGLHWLDPWSHTAVEAPFDWKQTALGWLGANKPWQKKAKPSSHEEMMRLRWFLYIKERFSDEPRLKFVLADGRWLNPLTGGWVSGLPVTGKLTREFVLGLAQHLAQAEMDGAGINFKSEYELKMLYDRARIEIERSRKPPPVAPPLGGEPVAIRPEPPPVGGAQGLGSGARPGAEPTVQPVDSPTVRQRRRLEGQGRSASSAKASGRRPQPVSAARPDLASTIPEALTLSQEQELLDAGYQVTELLGKGGMGSVFKALQLSLERTVALKVRIPVSGEAPKFIDRFLREARAAAQVAHPNVITVYDVGRTETMVYMAMEFLAGGDLEQLVEREGPLPEARTLLFLRHALQGLRAIHALDLIHRDIKSSNLFLSVEGELKIGDLGIAKDVEKGRQLTNEQAVLGTPAFMPPEQSIPGSTLDRRSDLYALGVTTYHVLTGRLPYPGSTPMEVLRAIITAPVPDPCSFRKDISPGTGLLVQHLMAKEPGERPAHCDEALAELDAIA